MRVLTDCRERLTEFVPAGTQWAAKAASTLDLLERTLWRGLADTPVAWTAPPGMREPSDFWRRVIAIDQASRSQFDILHEAIAGGLSLDGPTAVLAFGGRDFHGQRGRPWYVVAGNLFLTVALPVGMPASDVAPPLIALPAVAVVDAIHACSGGRVSPTIKWANDICLGDRKVGGVLAASVCREDVLETAVLGIGVNVARAPAVGPTPFVPAVGSLTEAGMSVSLATFFRCVLDRLAERYRALLEHGPGTLLRSYREASCVVGQRVRVWDESADYSGPAGEWPTPLAGGVVTSIETDLTLRIEGREDPVSGGRLALEEACVALGL